MQIYKKFLRKPLFGDMKPGFSLGLLFIFFLILSILVFVTLVLILGRRRSHFLFFCIAGISFYLKFLLFSALSVTIQGRRMEEKKLHFSIEFRVHTNKSIENLRLSHRICITLHPIWKRDSKQDVQQRHKSGNRTITNSSAEGLEISLLIPMLRVWR